MSQLQNNDFFDPYLLSFGLKNKAIFINDSSIINQRYQQLVALNDQFKAIITFQTKPIILILYLDISNNSIKISRRNDDLEEISINTLYIKEFNIVDIYNVFPSSNEEILYVQMYADNDKLVTISIKNDTKYDTVPFNNLDDNIEVISSKSQNYLTLREKPGHGYAATIFSSDIISLDNYLCRFGELIANKNIINNTEFLTITDLSSCKTVFEMKLEHPLIVSKIINNEVVLCLCNKEGINVLLNINYRTGQIISETEYQCSIEFHAQIKNRVMIKLMGLSEGVQWGYITEDGQIYLGFRTVNSVNYIKTKYINDKFSGILFEPKSVLVRGAIISLHGGPESFEFNEFRYNGVYRKLVEQGLSVLVLNYSGSAYRSIVSKKSIWKKWKNVLKEIYTASEFLLSRYKLRKSDITLFGVSFGGSLALLAGCDPKSFFKKIVAVAPLVNMSNHINKLDNEEYQWFQSRFSTNEITNLFSDKNFVKNISIPVNIIQGEYDGVLSYEESKLMVQKAQSKQLEWVLYTEKGTDHVPSNYIEKVNRHNFILKSLL